MENELRLQRQRLTGKLAQMEHLKTESRQQERRLRKESLHFIKTGQKEEL